MSSHYYRCASRASVLNECNVKLLAGSTQCCLHQKITTEEVTWMFKKILQKRECEQQVLIAMRNATADIFKPSSQYYVQ